MAKKKTKRKNSSNPGELLWDERQLLIDIADWEAAEEDRPYEVMDFGAAGTLESMGLIDYDDEDEEAWLTAAGRRRVKSERRRVVPVRGRGDKATRQLKNKLMR